MLYLLLLRQPRSLFFVGTSLFVREHVLDCMGPAKTMENTISINIHHFKHKAKTTGDLISPSTLTTNHNLRNKTNQVTVNASPSDHHHKLAATTQGVIDQALPLKTPTGGN
jgi:hypothetical protein